MPRVYAGVEYTWACWSALCYWTYYDRPVNSDVVGGEEDEAELADQWVHLQLVWLAFLLASHIVHAVEAAPFVLLVAVGLAMVLLRLQARLQATPIAHALGPVVWGLGPLGLLASAALLQCLDRVTALYEVETASSSLLELFLVVSVWYRWRRRVGAWSVMAKPMVLQVGMWLLTSVLQLLRVLPWLEEEAQTHWSDEWQWAACFCLHVLGCAMGILLVRARTLPVAVSGGARGATWNHQPHRFTRIQMHEDVPVAAKAIAKADKEEEDEVEHENPFAI